MVANQQKSVDVADLIGVVRRRKWLIIVPWIIVSLVVAAGSYLLTPRYQAFTIISIDPNISISSDLKRMLGLDNNNRDQGGRGDELKGIYNEVTSTSYVKQIADRVGLLKNPSLLESARKLAAGQPGVRQEDVQLDLLQTRLQGQLQVDFVASDQIRMIVQSSSPTEARDIANVMGEIFVTERLKQDIATIRNSQDFSDVQLQKYQTQLDQKIKERTDFEAKVLGSQQDQAIIAESNRRDISSEIDRATDDIGDLERNEKAILSQLQSDVNVPIEKLTLTDSDDNKKTRGELTQQVQSLGDLATRYPWSDPQILNTKLRHDALLRRIALENRRLVDDQYHVYPDSTRALLVSLFNDRANLDYAYGKKTELTAAMDQLKNRLRLVPEYKTTIDRLNREIESSTQLRDKFKAQQESSNMSQALLGDVSLPKYKVIEPAKLPLAPFSPNRAKIIGLGVLMGLVIGGAAVLLAELMDKSFKRVDDVEEYLGLHVLGVAPHIEYVKQVVK